MITTPCILFAGGKSSRMGEDKALLPFASFSTLAEYQYSRLSKIFTTVYISCKDASIFPFEANFIEDNKEQELYAPTAGFMAAFQAIEDEKFFVLSVDSPFVHEKIIQQLINADKETFDATIAKTDEGIQPLCGIYHKTLQKPVSKMIEEDNHRLGYLLKSVKTNYCYFPDSSPFLNMNHPHEYKKALSLINSLL